MSKWEELSSTGVTEMLQSAQPILPEPSIEEQILSEVRQVRALLERLVDMHTNQASQPVDSVINPYLETAAGVEHKRTPPTVGVRESEGEGPLKLNPVGQKRPGPVALGQKRPGPVALPVDFKPTAKHTAFCFKHGLSLPVQLSAFRDYHDLHGTKAASWNGKFATWLLNAKRFQERDKGKGLQVGAQLRGRPDEEARRIHRNELIAQARLGKYGQDVRIRAQSNKDLAKLADELEKDELSGTLQRVGFELFGG